MVLLDYIVIAVAVATLVGAGLLFARRGGKSTDEFILGGRRLPWWLAGTAMVAGSSNADSPLHQSGKIRRDGLTGAWFYWTQIINNVWHSLVFSRLWRRAEINTVVEFYEIRYAGRAKVIGRVWSMVFASFIEGTLGLALGMLAMIKICTVLIGLTEPVPLLGFMVAPEILLALGGVALGLAYSVVSGLFGVVAGDIVEFTIAMGCSYLLMVIVYREVGWSEGLAAGLARLGQEQKLSFTPALGFTAFVFFVFQPLASLAATNGINQRYLALRNEREAMLSGVWRVINHYFFRGWPWYICGLASLILITDPAVSREMAYPTLIAQYLPAGLRGLMFAGFLVAFMSSVSSNMHAAGSVFVNDFYRPYVVKGASEKHYVRAIRLAMLAFAAVATVIALASDHVLGLLQFLTKVVYAGGFVMLLRWFWWRVNGWADVAAQFLALPVTLFYDHAGKLLGPQADLVARVATVLGDGTPDANYGVSFVLTVTTTTVLWAIVMLCTPPEPMEKLADFYQRVRPYGWWGPVARRCPDVVITDRFAADARLYVLGLGLSLGLLFGLGFVLLGRTWSGLLLLLLGAVCGTILVRAIDRCHAPAPVPAGNRPTPSLSDVRRG